MLPHRNSACQKIFRQIFVRDFNIGFRAPFTDVCSFCEKISHEIRIKQGKDKVQAMIEKRVHKLRATAFYTSIKSKPDDTRTYCFDLQQVQPLPKVPIQEQFYSRQISFYAFVCVDVSSVDPTFYTWTEIQAGRGPNEIGSALLHFLCHETNLDVVKHLRLFCDGCGGQNKNSHISHKLLY